MEIFTTNSSRLEEKETFPLYLETIFLIEIIPKPCIEESYSPIDDFYDEEELLQKRNQLLAELKKLPEQEYNVLVKIILEDKKYKEVAEELHISINTVKTHLSRALKMLRRFNMTEILILFNL